MAGNTGFRKKKKRKEKKKCKITPSFSPKHVCKEEKKKECKGFSCDHSLSEQEWFILYIDSLKC